ncbi:hypothetical protein [Tenacibaculum sp. 190524A02b]|uniref:DUF4488 domain-containing protein n=1 Tax=Tenacibaculum vairaonense TaxID=3137860 RepID=A0ABM9PJ01_9FLAO
MKNSTLLFRTLFFIILIAGSAHLVSYASKSNTYTTNSGTEKLVKTSQKTSNTIDFEGKWKVQYKNTEFNGFIIYHIKKEGSVFNAYTYKYEDENGYSENAPKEKILTIKSSYKNSAKGMYILTYKNEKYKVDCKINIHNNHTFKLSYNAYGYNGVETWKKLK